MQRGGIARALRLLVGSLLLPGGVVAQGQPVALRLSSPVTAVPTSTRASDAPLGAAWTGTYTPSTSHSLPPARPSSVQAPSVNAPWWAPAASAVVPGAGQFVLKQQRSVAYLVAEGFLVVQYLAARRDRNNERAAYRALANDVARKQFGGSMPQGSWDYYEHMEKFLESGVYDRIPGGAVDPETDATTYNGARWLLARETFWRDADSPPAVTSAEYQRALAFYTRDAITDAYRWSWRDAQLQQDLYVQTIRSANRGSQRAVNVLGVVAVNHLTSLIDAYVSVRVRRYGGAGVAGLAIQQVHTAYIPDADGLAGRGRWQASISLGPAR